MSEPLSDEDVRRIARQTARELIKRVLDLGLLLIATAIVALVALPMLIVATVNSFAPPLSAQPNPIVGVVIALTLVVVVVVLARSWSILMRDR
jgi:lipopolysaccharide/colanic/teichoic acid biosynthesis glycosyltransferase